MSSSHQSAQKNDANNTTAKKPANQEAISQVDQVHPGAAVQRAMANPGALSPSDVQRMQQAGGNRAVAQLLSGQRNSRPAASPANVVQRKPANVIQRHPNAPAVSSPLQALLDAKTVLRKGDKGKDVRLIQEALIAKGISLGKFGADGDFGNATKKAVVKFQDSNDLKPDGIVGSNTIKALMKSNSSASAAPTPTASESKPDSADNGSNMVDDLVSGAAGAWNDIKEGVSNLWDKFTTPDADGGEKDKDKEKKGPQPEDELIAGVTNVAAVKNKRRAAALKLAEWARDNVPNRQLLDAYLASDVPKDEKVSAIGQIATAIARMEFLLGWIYEGGIKDADGKGWENDGTNQGAFPSYYKDAIKTHGKTGPWCTTFAGYAYKQAGFNFSDKAGDAESKSIFWSGYRLRHWAKTGKSNSGTVLTDKGQRSGDAESSGALIDKDAWKGLRTQLDKSSKAEARKAALTEFFETNPMPQSGDIMVIGGNDNTFRKGGHSHTVMVDRFSAEDFTVSTVEGNANNAVSARKIDLSKPDQVGGIISLVRLGAENFGKGDKEDADQKDGDKPDTTPKPGAAPADNGKKAAAVTADQVLQSVNDMNAKLVELSHSQGWIKSSDPTATVYEWMNGAKDKQKGESQKIADQ